jgi:hypothetical protein
MIKKSFVLGLAFFMSLSGAFAMRILVQRDSLELVLKKTASAVVVTVRAVSIREGDSQNVVNLDVAPVRVIFGTSSDKPFPCRYTEDIPRHVSVPADSPHAKFAASEYDVMWVTGSGMEFDVKAGDQVILLMAQPADADKSLKVLRIESLDQLESVESSR